MKWRKELGTDAASNEYVEEDDEVNAAGCFDYFTDFFQMLTSLAGDVSDYDDPSHGENDSQWRGINEIQTKLGERVEQARKTLAKMQRDGNFDKALSQRILLHHLETAVKYAEELSKRFQGLFKKAKAASGTDEHWSFGGLLGEREADDDDTSKHLATSDELEVTSDRYDEDLIELHKDFASFMEVYEIVSEEGYRPSDPSDPTSKDRVVIDGTTIRIEKDAVGADGTGSDKDKASMAGGHDAFHDESKTAVLKNKAESPEEVCIWLVHVVHCMQGCMH